MKKKTRLSQAEVKKIAKLASLELSSDEVDKFQGWLSEALNYIDVLKELDTSRIAETSQVTGLTNVCREDEVRLGLTESEALSNAPVQLRGNFKVAAALEHK